MKLNVIAMETYKNWSGHDLQNPSKSLQKPEVWLQEAQAGPV